MKATKTKLGATAMRVVCTTKRSRKRKKRPQVDAASQYSLRCF